MTSTAEEEQNLMSFFFFLNVFLYLFVMWAKKFKKKKEN